MSDALLIVDFQNDLTPGGALAVRDGDALAERINELAASGDYELVVATRDWHPPDHASFTAAGGPWPEHCVQGTEGAELHPALDRARVHVVVDKGRDRESEGCSGFDDTDLETVLRERGIERVTVVGLAMDHCVKHTALDALRHGFQVTVDSTAVGGVEEQEGDSERALAEVRAAGGAVA